MGVIKTKINHPFIYFFMEPNVVFVYKIELQNYITVSELGEAEEWVTYELNLGEEFDVFDHEKSKPLEGKSYFIKQDDINIMAEKINKQIQRQRKFSTEYQEENNEVSSSIHIVASEDAAGSLRVGLDRPKIVIGFPDFFSIGPVWKLGEKKGQTFRNEWLIENINSEQDDYEYENKFTKTLLEIEDIPDQFPIHVWYANNASEQVGVHLILHLLRGKANDVVLINSTELHDKYITNEDNDQPLLHTSQLKPENIKLIFEQIKTTKPISSKDRIQFERQWQTLEQTKEILRLWVNEEIKSVADHHFDPLIINTLKQLHHEQVNKDFIKTGRVIGEILNRMEEWVSGFFLEFRIRHLIYSGVLELKGIPKSMRHYSVKLR